MMDWVPINGYGVARTVPPATQLDFSLFDPDDVADIGGEEVIGVREDASPRRKILRIVGEFYLSTDTLIEMFQWHMRVWPGFVTDGPVVRSAGALGSQVSANARLWWDRRAGLNNGPLDWGSDFAHPWHRTIDIRPNQVLEERETAVLSLNNLSNVASVRMTAWWRMLVS